MKVSNPYFICFTVRSGSAMMFQLLTDTGIAGLPEEHFFHNINSANLTGDDIADYGRYNKKRCVWQQDRRRILE